MQRKFYVYIMFNHRDGTLYTGVTNDIWRRVQEHKARLNIGAFTARYGCDKLGYFEILPTAEIAIGREKQIKSGPRRKKIELINSINPDWRDLSLEPDFGFDSGTSC